MTYDDVPLHRDRDGEVNGGRLRRQTERVDVGRRVRKGENDGVEERAPPVIGDDVITAPPVVVGQDVVGEARKSAHENGTEYDNNIDGSH